MIKKTLVISRNCTRKYLLAERKAVKARVNTGLCAASDEIGHEGQSRRHYYA